MAEMPPKCKSTIVKLRENHLLENVDSVRKVMFKKVLVETVKREQRVTDYLKEFMGGHRTVKEPTD